MIFKDGKETRNKYMKMHLKDENWEIVIKKSNWKFCTEV
jgi:hypothetical protein